MQESKLLLFLSADIVGSTAYKHNNRESQGRPQPWLQFFKDFYQEFPSCVRSYSLKGQPHNATSPHVWKTAGDELLFVVEVGCHTQVLDYIYAFKQAMAEYAHGIKSKKLPLDIKGCAWVAGFPVINAEVRPDGGSEDYIGPLIDAGFRLAKYSSPRKFILSVEAALLALVAMENPAAPNLTFYFDGKEVLKGVLSERPYPVVWVDMLNGSPPLEEELRGIDRKPAARAALKSFCEGYIEDATPNLVMPYMRNCTHSLFSQMPDIHRQILLAGDDPQGMLEANDGSEPDGTGEEKKFLLQVRTAPAIGAI